MIKRKMSVIIKKAKGEKVRWVTAFAFENFAMFEQF